MSDSLYIIPFASLDLENIKYHKLYRTSNGLVKGVFTYKDHDVLIKGPKMSLGSDVVKNGDYYYIDLVFDHNSKNNMNFMKFIRSIDHLSIAEIYEKSKLWYSKKQDDTSLVQIEQEYVPTIKLSSVYSDRESLKLKIPVDKIEYFDQDNVILPYQLVKENFQVIPLFKLVATYKDTIHIWTEWQILQLKIHLSDTMFKGCQLVDVEIDVSEDEEAVPNEDDLDEEDDESNKGNEHDQVIGNLDED
jgi:hypothetical protein